MISIGLGVLGLSAIGLIGGAILHHASKGIQSQQKSLGRFYRRTATANAMRASAQVPSYAEAIADGEAINRCPPGGQAHPVDRIAIFWVPTLSLWTLIKTSSTRTWLSSSKKNVSGARNVFRHVQWTQSSAPTNSCVTVIIDDCTGCDLCVDPVLWTV